MTYHVLNTARMYTVNVSNLNSYHITKFNIFAHVNRLNNVPLWVRIKVGGFYGWESVQSRGGRRINLEGNIEEH